jgi:hypothetical protein
MAQTFRGDLPDTLSEIFLRRGLDSRLRLDRICEIGFLAQPDLPAFRDGRARRDDLLHPSALEEAGVRGVLFDIRGVALFVGVLRMVFLVRRVFRRFGILWNALVAPICRRDRRHTTGHLFFLYDVQALHLRPKRPTA